jgi:predicted oxidoreductase
VDGLNVRCAVSCPHRPATVARPNPIWPPGAGHGFRLLSGFRSLWAATAGERLAPDAGGRPLTFTDTLLWLLGLAGGCASRHPINCGDS